MLYSNSRFVLAACFMAVLVGCNGQSAVQTPPKGGGHDHAEHGPHGGELVFFEGTKYHAELVTEGDDITIYMLDEAAKNEVAVDKQELMMHIDVEGEHLHFDFAPVPAEGGAEGRTTMFKLNNHELAAALNTEAMKTAELSMNLDGKPHSASFEHGHVCHGHSHGHDHDDGSDELLVWHVEETVEGHDVKLGQHGLIVLAGEQTEPAAIVESGGEPVADAKLSVRILATDGETELASEQTLEFEPKTEEEPAHFAGAKFAVPEDAEKILVQYVLTLPGESEPRIFDIRLTTEKIE